MGNRRLFWVLPVLTLLAACNRDPHAQAQRYVEIGNNFFGKAKYKEASIMYLRALRKDMRFGEAYYRLGLTDLKLSAYGDAVKTLRRAVELEPNNSDAASKLADLLMLGSSQTNSSISEQLRTEVDGLADKLLKLNPESFDGHRLKGQLAMVKRDFPTAVKELELAHKANPAQLDVSLVMFQAMVANNQFPDAETLAKQTIANHATYSPMYDVLYLQYVRQNKLDLAEQILKLKGDNNPKNAVFQIQLATHYLLTNRRSDLDAVIQKLADEKQYPEGHLLAGDFFFRRAHQLDRAQTQYETGIHDSPKEKAIYQKRLVELFAVGGKNLEANQMLAAVLKDNPKDNDAIAMRAALMLQTGNRDQINMAAADLQSLVTKTPNNYQLRFNLARALIAKREIEGARLQLEAAIKTRPDFIAARELVARLYLAKGDAGGALKAADDLITIDHNNLQGHLVRSSAMILVGDRDQAHKELDEILTRNPQNTDARFQVAYLAFQEKDYKKAEGLLAEMYKANPKDARALAGLVDTYAAENHMDQAIKLGQEAVAREPERREPRLFLGNLYVRAEKYNDAIQMFQDLLAKDPRSADLYFRLGETNRLKGDLNTAIEDYRHCSSLAPNNSLCLVQLGLLLEGTGKSDQAKPVYEQVLKIEPDEVIALNNLAFMKAEDGTDLDQALSMAQRAKQKAPNNNEVADTLGWVFIKKNLSDDAVRVFQDLVLKQPNNFQFHYHYGMALIEKGDKPLARREFEAALKDNPSTAAASKIREQLAKL